MRIRSVKFLKSATVPQSFDCKKEIALVGRSNVGKSSLINYITNRKIAKESSSPGRTRLLNYFEINDGEFLLVDLPGYGYSVAGKEQSEGWGKMIEGYLLNNPNLKNLLFLVDIRLEPSEKDLMLMQFMVYYNIPFTVVATKSDKLSRAQQQISKQKIATKLKIGIDNIYVVSSTKRVGAEQLLDRIEQFLE